MNREQFELKQRLSAHRQAENRNAHASHPHGRFQFHAAVSATARGPSFVRIAPHPVSILGGESAGMAVRDQD